MNDVTKLRALWLERLKPEDPMRQELLNADENDITERFYRDLTFGTGGLRGIMGAGTNRMNPITVAAAARGVGESLKKQSCAPSCAVCHDSRNNSRAFALLTARVMSHMGIRVYLYDSLKPTPMLSYAVRSLGCTGGVMITASHNPREYNGFKAYGSDGSQLDEIQAEEIMGYIKTFDGFTEAAYPADESLISPVPDSVIEGFYREAMAQVREKDAIGKAELSVVYTPLHGAGLVPVTTVLGRLGVEKLHIVPSQKEPDGNFPTCPKPNPELPEAFEQALKLAQQVQPDLVIATDPDADRMACGVRHNGEYRLLTGNELGVLFVDYELDRRGEHCVVTHDPYILDTIVSTPMAKRAAEYYGCRTASTLTGFKNIAALMRAYENEGKLEGFVMGFEESIGYLFGTFVRDKDSVTASAKLCEMAAFYKNSGKTLVDKLEELYDRLGCFLTKTLSFTYEGKAGAQTIGSLMEFLRTEPMVRIGGKLLLETEDVEKGTKIDRRTKQETPSLLPSASVLCFYLDDDCSVIVRPSGTEPKIKVYCTAFGETRDQAEEALAAIAADMEAKCKV